MLAEWLDPHMDAIVRVAAGAEAVASVRSFADLCANKLDDLAIEANLGANLPQLRRWDGHGNRIEQVVLHPATAAIGDAAWAAGTMADWAEGRNVAALAKVYLLAQSGEAGQCCPLACTAGMIRILQQTPAQVPTLWLTGLSTRGVDRLWASQFLTEVQGGSDVGANVLEARERGDGTATLHGEKWFCSVIDAPLFLVTARPQGGGTGTAGRGAYVMPRAHAGSPNGFSVRRLKDKLGTRSMASAEVDFDGAEALRVGDFKDVVEVVLNTSRVFNAVCCAGFMARAEREARAFAHQRVAFGAPIATFPSVARVLARARTEAFAARSLAMRLAGEAMPSTPGTRMLVNLCKTWTASTCPSVVRDAIEVLGGNGAIEDFSVLPRLLRDSIVLEAWEGGHGVLAAQILRDARRGMLAPMFDILDGWLGRAHGRAAIGTTLRIRLTTARRRWENLLARDDADAHVRDLIDELRPLAMAASMLADLASTPSLPLVGVAIEHLLATTERGWDPLMDEGLDTRVRALASQAWAG